ncbi:MAG TPA: hypothetical protein VFG54_12210 [Prolixibacteraceae bacterium]|nr:hypothetical protein [Prolixibacteraceae bacterium]
MATVSETLERLHPDVIQNFLDTGKASGIAPEVVRYIEKIDKIPDLYRQCQNPTRTSRELMRLYPDLFSSFKSAQALVYAAINHFHLNCSIKNQAWDNLYADRFDELAKIEVKRGNIEAAKRIYTEAHRLRTLRNEDSLDVEKLRPIVQVISPEVTPQMIDIDGNYSLKEMWSDVKVFVKHQVKNVSDEQKAAILREAGKTLNIEDADFEDADQ